MSDNTAIPRATERHMNHTLHMPAEVYNQIKDKAEKQQRSFNWTAVRLLIAAIEQEKQAE